MVGMKFFTPVFLVASSVAAAIIPNSPVATGSGVSRRQTVANPQTALQVDPSVIGPNLASNGLNGAAEAGQVASLTSTNNFINFCLTTGLPNTNGQQIIDGSCNSVPMGVIVARARMPSSKFQFPQNLAVIAPNTQFTIEMSVSNMATGNFVNPQTNYFGAPQQVNGQGIVIAHSHVVIETIASLDSVAVTNPQNFAFFKGLNAAAQGGVLTATVTGGLPAGTYRLSSINTAANHQPILGAVAQHGSFDDIVYFTVGDAPATGGGAAASASSASASAASSSASVAASSVAATTSVSSAAATSAAAATTSASSAAATSAATTTAPAVSAAPSSATASSASASPTAGGNPGGNNGRGNLQKFLQSLGGIQPPAVTPNGKFFSVAGNDQRMNSLRSALQRSCDIQNNLCANAANSRRGRFAVRDCSAQLRLCLALLPRN